MSTKTVTAGSPVASSAPRWLARLSLLAAALAVVALLVGGRGKLLLLVVGVAGVAVGLAGAWWFLSHRGLVRWLGAVLAVAAPLAVVVLYVARGRLLEIAVFVALVAVALSAARAATARVTPAPTPMPESPTTPPSRPFLIMNPRSGGGKVGRFRLDELARAMGAEVALLEGPGQVDVADLARSAAAEGADLLGVAGGDGTQALVAGIASGLDLPFLVLSAGTRNHFALDLGLDREHPDAGLHALTDGVELRIDLGDINGRTFVNNVSFGAYADIVQSPEYRDDKRGTTLQMLPDILAGHRGPRLRVRIDGGPEIPAPQALLVSNNPYGLGDLAGLGRRARLDGGVLGAVAITVGSAAGAAALVGGRHTRGVMSTIAREVVVDADVPEIPVGIDGEAVMVATPVRCTVRPGALRVRVPRERPGVPDVRPPVDWTLVRRQALTLRRLAAGQDRPAA